MKRIVYILITLFAISCGNATYESGWTLTEDGVGSLKMLQPFSDMSSGDEGLYNNIQKSLFYDERNMDKYQIYTLYLNEEKVANFMTESEESPIDQLGIYSPRIALDNGVKVGMPLRDAIKKDGVDASIIFDESWNSPVLCIRYGEHITIGEYGANENLSESGEMKAAELHFDGEFETLDKLLVAKIEVEPEDIKEDAVVSVLFVDRRDYGY